MSSEDLVVGLWRMGYNVKAEEVKRLVRVLGDGASGKLDVVNFAASQIDWEHVQATYKDTWMELAKQAFEEMDVEDSGFLTWRQLLYALNRKVDPSEMHAAVQQSLVEAGDAVTDISDPATGGLDLNAFCAMLQTTPSRGDLRLYDGRDELYDDRVGEARVRSNSGTVASCGAE